MNKGKLIVLAAFIILIFFGIFWWFKTASPSDMNIKILVLNNDLLVNDSATIRYLNDFVKKTHEYIYKEKPLTVSLELFGSAGVYKPKMVVKRKPGERDWEWEKEILDSLESLFFFPIRVTLSNNETNELFVKFLQTSIEEPDAVMLVAGSFPECYDHPSKMQLIEEINKTIAKLRNKFIVVNGVIDCRKGLEADIFDTLAAKKRFIVETMNLPKIPTRRCEESDLPLVFGMFFDLVKEDDFNDYLEFLQRQIGQKFVLTFWNDGPKNNFKLKFLNNTLDSVELKKHISVLTKAKWASINFLFKHCYNTLSLLPEATKKYVVMTGNFPPYGQRRVLDEEFWTQLRKVPNVFYFHYTKRPTRIDREYVEVMRRYKNLPVKTSY